MGHIPVLLQEVIAYLRPAQGKKIIDATVGMGGHARDLIEAGATVLGIDRDPSVISKSEIRNPKLEAVHGNFEKLAEIAKEYNFIEVDGILFDLGLGSHQLDEASRGFAFQKEGPLDMRYDQSIGKTAGELVNFYPEKELIKIFQEFGEERRFAKRIVRGILETRKTRSIKTTEELFDLVKKALPGQFRFRSSDTARRIFQALRIAVNAELKNLARALPQAVDVLKLRGRLAVISFHSLEDRIVKRFFINESKDCICPPSFPICRCEAKARLRILTKKPIIPKQQEIKTNPRAQSAKLRVAEKIWGDSLP